MTQVRTSPVLILLKKKKNSDNSYGLSPTKSYGSELLFCLGGYSRRKKKNCVYLMRVLTCATIALLLGNLKLTSAVLMAKAPKKFFRWNFNEKTKKRCSNSPVLMLSAVLLCTSATRCQASISQNLPGTRKVRPRICVSLMIMWILAFLYRYYF